MSEKKVGVISLGCDKNRVDTEYMLSIILGSSYKLTNEIAAAQVLIINTCAFLESARQEAIDTILDCAQKKLIGVEKIVVTGCLSQKFIEQIYDDLQEVDVFLGTQDYDLLPEALDLAYSGQRVNFVGKKAKLEHSKRVLSTPKSYAYLKISEGCSNQCTYCLIPKIRGSYKSEELEKLLDQTKNLGTVSELILVAQDITRYGQDLKGQNLNLVELLKKLTALENVQKVRLLYCYPDQITDQLIKEIATNDKIIKYLDMPLQHSEDKILRLMNRKGTKSAYLELINKLRAQVENIALRSTFITGFPGESKKDFLGLVKFIKQVKFFNAGFFAYSREEETKAYHFENQLSQKIKQKRVKKLYKVQNKIARKILKGFVGKELEVICDQATLGECKARAYFSAPDIDTYVYLSGVQCNIGAKYIVKVVKVYGLDLYAEFISQVKE